MLTLRTSTIAAGAAAAALLVGASGAHAKTIIGSPGNDTLKAKTSAGDMLWGGGGPDVLRGGKGNDLLYGGRSNNKIWGGGGNDYIESGLGSDYVNTGPGNNTVIGGSGHDEIIAGDGNNWIDSGGAPDTVTAGNGNNVIITGSGGGKFKAGNGNNTVYYGSGLTYFTLGKGVNTIYLSGTAGLKELDCGGNPQSKVFVNSVGLGEFSIQIMKREKLKGCPTVELYDGNKRVEAKIAGLWESFDLKGGANRDKLFGGHGGGTIDAGEGDNEIWADHNEDTGLPRSQEFTTRINAGNGNNLIFGGRGTNIITAGNGNNSVRAGAWVNDIRLGSGSNLVRLQGAQSTNTVTISGRGQNEGTFIESLANGKKPVLNCINGAKAIVVYGNTKPTGNCGPKYDIRSKKGAEIAIVRTPGIAISDPIIDPMILPGEQGFGVPRPVPGA